jgi:hypothetical protein
MILMIWVMVGRGGWDQGFSDIRGDCGEGESENEKDCEGF